MKPADELTRRLRLTPEAVRVLMDQLDQGLDGEPASNQRGAERYSYRVAALTVELQQPSANWVRHIVTSRNLSRGGIALLIGQFVYPGSAVRVHLRSVHDHEVLVTGKLARCRYVIGSASLYDVAVRFDQPIEVEMFHRGAARVHVLYFDEDAAMHKLVEKLIVAQNVELHCASAVETASAFVEKNRVDVALLALDPRHPDGLRPIQRIQQQGYYGPIIALVDEHSPEIARSCAAAGCAELLKRPVAREDLLRVINSSKTPPIVSTQAHDAALHESIDAFVTGLPRQVADLEAALTQAQFDELGRQLRMLRSQSGVLGFNPITDAATRLEQAITRKEEVDSLRGILNDLRRWCVAARPVTPPPDAQRPN